MPENNNNEGTAQQAVINALLAPFSSPIDYTRNPKMIKHLTLNEAMNEIKKKIAVSREKTGYQISDGARGMQEALDILENVEMPSEDEMAVIWLMKKKSIYIHWVELHHVHGWFADTHLEYTRWREVVPSEEARKLGWER